MRPVVFVAALAVGVMVAVACGGGGQRDRTGVPEVDRIIEAVLGQDIGTLAALARYQEEGCSAKPLGQIPEPPPCQTGQTDGSPVDVFLAGLCQGYYVTREEMPDFLGQQLGESELQIYAVYRTRSFLGLDTDYVVLFDVRGAQDNVGGKSLAITNDGIEALISSCGPLSDVAASLQEQGAETVLGPTGE